MVGFSVVFPNDDLQVHARERCEFPEQLVGQTLQSG